MIENPLGYFPNSFGKRILGSSLRVAELADEAARVHLTPHYAL
jgi:hypothetical protein